MKRRLAPGCLALLLLSYGGTVAAPKPESGFAVVELFTSEGCSSCPPADRLLGELVDEAARDRRPIYPLAFHVDIWDSLGWKDSFGDAAYTRRQRDYARVLGLNGVYTPQMIVNGHDEFVGSDAGRARRSIEAALRGTATAGVTLKIAAAAAAGPVAVEYAVSGTPPGAVLRLALVERGLASQVRRGENAGRDLRHENVVRAFRTVPLDGSLRGRVELELPPGAARSRCSVIGYVQDPATLAILGAAGAEE